MKKQLFFTLLISFTFFGLRAQNTNLVNLISSNEWNSMFPNRAGLKSGHQQGVTIDFYSYNNFKKAISEMSNYRISFRKKAGIAGQITTVTNKSNDTKYEISSVPVHWYSHGGTESTLEVDFGDFINTSSQFNNKRELGAFLANISKETTGGWQNVGSGSSGDHSKWGLHWVEELNPTHDYRKTDGNYPPSPGQTYIGRGPIQLSYNDNYGQVSAFLYNDITVLLDDPGAVSRDGVLAFKTAIWFWMMPQCPKPSCHQVMHDLWKTNSGEYSSSKMYKKGFAHTNNIINGGLECRSNTSGAFKTKVTLRSNLYIHYLELLGLSQSQIDQENIGDYSTLCYASSSNTMQDYASCDVQQSGPVCSEPSLGTDQTICENPIDLDAGVNLISGESIKWYKNNQLIPGAISTTYTATTAGTYKAEVNSSECSRFDVITLTPGGDLVASASNGGKYCKDGATTSVKIDVTGGAGLYNFYTSESGGSSIASGGSLDISGNDIPKGQSQTYYVEESAGETAVIGPDVKITDNSDWVNIVSDLSWNKISQVFTAHNTVKLESVDFYFGWIGDGNDHTLNVKVYEFGTSNLVASKSYTYAGWGDAEWNGDGLNTVELGFSFDAGQYEFVTIESNILLWQTVGEPASDIGYSPWTSPGMATLDGAYSPDNPDWGVFKNYNQGTYNWKFSSGSDTGCGRYPITVTHEDCDDSGNNGDDGENSVENVIIQTLNIYPNPASESVNVAFEMNTADDIQVAIYNAVGVLVNTTRLVNTKGEQLVNFDASNMSGGLYFVRLNSSTGSITKTISIVK